MSFYEELLALGQDLREHERSALYKFLLSSEKDRISTKAKEIIDNCEGRETVANGEIYYVIVDNKISYSVRRLDSTYTYENIRTASLGSIKLLNLKKVRNFIAQAEVEVMWNCPLPGENSQESAGFGIVSYPFSDLRYYSNGRGRLLGLIKKMQGEDSDILRKLQAS